MSFLEKLARIAPLAGAAVAGAPSLSTARVEPHTALPRAQDRDMHGGGGAREFS